MGLLRFCPVTLSKHQVYCRENGNFTHKEKIEITFMEEGIYGHPEHLPRLIFEPVVAVML